MTRKNSCKPTETTVSEHHATVARAYLLAMSDCTRLKLVELTTFTQLDDDDTQVTLENAMVTPRIGDVGETNSNRLADAADTSRNEIVVLLLPAPAYFNRPPTLFIDEDEGCNEASGRPAPVQRTPHAPHQQLFFSPE